MTTRLAAAAAFAVDQFDGIVRKGNGTPYITHLFAVCALVGEYGGSEDQMIAALLHDWLEDVEGSSVEELTQRFGAPVAETVLALSDTTVRPKPPWQERKEQHIAHLKVQSAQVRLVAAADKLHNGSALLRDWKRDGDAAFDIFNASKAQTLWYYQTVTEVLHDGWSHPILDALDEVMAGLKAAETA